VGRFFHLVCLFAMLTFYLFRWFPGSAGQNGLV
jgi:hypothetical protein